MATVRADPFMFRFFKELYLTGFIIIFKVSRAKNIAYKAGGAIGFITVIEWLILLGISSYMEMFVGKMFLFSKPVILIAFLALFFLNQYILFIRGYGIKFEREFDKLEKSRKILLIVSCAILALSAIVFFVWSSIAYRHFIGVN
jgi:hypothetical protein